MRRCRASRHRVAVASKISSGVKLKEYRALVSQKLKKSISPNTLTRARVKVPGRARRTAPNAPASTRPMSRN